MGLPASVDYMNPAGTSPATAPDRRIWNARRIGAITLFALIPLALIAIPHGVTDSLLGVAGQVGSLIIFARSH